MLARLTLSMLAWVAWAPADEGSPATSVSWQAPEDCPDAEAVAARVAQLIGRTPGPGELRVVGLVTAVEGGYALALHVEAAGLVDDRRLVADRCDALADTTALVASLSVDPVATATAIDVPAVVASHAGTASDPVGGDPSGPPVTGETPSAPPAPSVRTPAPRRAAGPVGVWTRIGGGGQFGAVPGWTGGFELAVAVGVRRLRGELAGAWWIPRRVDRSVPSLRVQLGTVAARVCATLPSGPVDLVACGGPEVGIMRGDVGGGLVRQPLWFAITALAGVRAPLSPRFSLWVGVAAVAPVRYPRFRLVDPSGAQQREVYRPATAGVRALLGVEVRLRGREAPRAARGRPTSMIPTSWR